MCSDGWCPCCEDFTASCDDPLNCDDEDTFCYACSQGMCDHGEMFGEDDNEPTEPPTVAEHFARLFVRESQEVWASDVRTLRLYDQAKAAEAESTRLAAELKAAAADKARIAADALTIDGELHAALERLKAAEARASALEGALRKAVLALYFATGRIAAEVPDTEIVEAIEAIDAALASPPAPAGARCTKPAHQNKWPDGSCMECAEERRDRFGRRADVLKWTKAPSHDIWRCDLGNGFEVLIAQCGAPPSDEDDFGGYSYDVSLVAGGWTAYLNASTTLEKAQARAEDAPRLLRAAAEAIERASGPTEPVGRKGGCKDWNYHVFALGATKCSVCGAPRAPEEKPA